MAATAHRGYWPGCYSPQYSLGVLAWLLQDPGWPGGTGLAATGPGWPGRTGLAATGPKWPLGVLAWLLQAPGWPLGYWPGCCRP